MQSYLEKVDEAENLEKMSVEDHSELSSSDISADKRESSDALTSNSSPPVYSTPFTIANYPFRKLNLNYEPKYTVPEDILLVKNAGSFGQKVWQGHSGDKAIVESTTEAVNDKYANFRKSFNSNVSSKNKDDSEELYATITHEPFMYAQRKENISDNLSFDNLKTTKDPRTKNFEENFDIRSITENSPLGKTNVVSLIKNYV